MGHGGKQRIPRPVGWQPGAATAWGGDGWVVPKLPLAEVRRRLAVLPPARPAPHFSLERRASAVLVPLFEEDGEARG